MCVLFSAVRGSSDIKHYANQPTCPLWLLHPNFTSIYCGLTPVCLNSFLNVKVAAFNQEKVPSFRRLIVCSTIYYTIDYRHNAGWARCPRHHHHADHHSWWSPAIITANGPRVQTSAANRSIGSTTGCTITEKAPNRAFSWLKAPTSAFTFKTLLRHYAKRALTPRSLNVKLGPRHNYHKGWAAIRHYVTNPPVPFDFCVADPI